MFPPTQPSADTSSELCFSARSHCAVCVVHALDTLPLWATCPLGLGSQAWPQLHMQALFQGPPGEQRTGVQMTLVFIHGRSTKTQVTHCLGKLALCCCDEALDTVQETWCVRIRRAGLPSTSTRCSLPGAKWASCKPHVRPLNYKISDSKDSHDGSRWTARVFSLLPKSQVRFPISPKRLVSCKALSYLSNCHGLSKTKRHMGVLLLNQTLFQLKRP